MAMVRIVGMALAEHSVLQSPCRVGSGSSPVHLLFVVEPLCPHRAGLAETTRSYPAKGEERRDEAAEGHTELELQEVDNAWKHEEYADA